MRSRQPNYCLTCSHSQKNNAKLLSGWKRQERERDEQEETIMEYYDYLQAVF